MILTSSAPRWARATRTTAAITTAVTLALGVFVTHPLIGTCDPCDPPATKQKKSDAVDLFVIGNEGAAKGNLLHLVDLNTVKQNEIQLADLFVESKANDGGKTDQRRARLEELMVELDRKKAQIVKLEAELARYQGDLERAAVFQQRAAQMAANNQALVEKRYAEAAKMFDRAKDSVADQKTRIAAIRDQLKAGDYAAAERNYQQARSFLERSAAAKDLAKAREDVYRQRQADLAATAKKRQALQDEYAKRAADMAAADRNALLADQKALKDAYSKLAAEHNAAMQDRQKVIYAEKQALEEAYRKLDEQRAKSDSVRTDYADRIAYMTQRADRDAQRRAVAVDLLQMVLAREGKLRDSDIAQIKQYLADTKDSDLSRKLESTRNAQSTRKARDAKASAEIMEMRQMLREFREMRDELLDLRNQIRAQRGNSRSTDLKDLNGRVR